MENELEKWKETKVNFYLERYKEYLEKDSINNNNICLFKFFKNNLNLEEVKNYYINKVENNLMILINKVKSIIGTFTKITKINENTYQFINNDKVCTAKAFNIDNRCTRWLIYTKD